MPQNPPPLAAEIEPVSEVSLLGTAAPAPWAGLLQNEGLALAEVEGKAQFLITASDSVFKGFPFREVALSVKVSTPDGEEGYYLVHAFNSSRFFAFIERKVFHTPYYPAAITVDAQLPASVRVWHGADELFRAEMAPEAASRRPLRDAFDGYQGPLYLQGGKLFFATLEGQTQTYAFDPARDVATVAASAHAPMLQRLHDSGFQGTEWIIRTHARHAKSKTVRWGGR